MSNSVSNISFRYHREDEQLEDNYDTSSSISTSSISNKSEGNSEESNTSGSSVDSANKVLGRLNIREDSDKWKLFRELKGHITKSVEEKIEEIKSERLKNQSKQRRAILNQMENSSVSDSEDQSETLQPTLSDKVTKSATETVPVKDKTDEKLESDVSYSLGSTPERSTTPVPSPDDGVEEDKEQPLNKGKGVKGVLKRKKGKTKNDKGVPFEKTTTIAFSTLCDNDSDSENVEVAQEVRERLADSVSETYLAQELERLAHPSLWQRVVCFLTDWNIFLLPLAALLLNWFTQLPPYLSGFLTGVVIMLLLQKFIDLVRELLGSSEPPMRQLKDMLPLKEVPIFTLSHYDSDMAQTVYKGWMNEYNREYSPETYHITLTETVFLQLEGSKLRLSSPRGKVPKRALWNEPRYNLQFNRERLYDITNCKVELKPHGLIHRRCWSKKYPICITLNPNSKLGVRFREKNDETVNEKAPWIEEEKYIFETVSEESDDESTFPSINVEKQDSFAMNSQASLESMSVTSEDSVPFLDLQSTSKLPEDELEDLEDDFVKIKPSTTQQESFIYLFARTDREKETWFRRLLVASKGTGSPEGLKGQRRGSKGSPTPKTPTLNYLTFMLTLSQRTVGQLPLTKEQNVRGTGVQKEEDLTISKDMSWLNAFLGRVLFDVFQDPDKLIKIQEKIQRKLSAIKLPIFLEQLEVSHLDLGQAVPIVQRATKPVLDSQGIWVDLDIIYEGGFKMTIDTKLNLNRIKQMQAESPSSESPKSGSPAKAPTPSPTPLQERKSAVYDSEVEDSAETSSEEPDLARLQDPTAVGAGPGTQHKYLRILDKVAQSKYFQQVVDYKFIKKFVSGNNLQLVVEVKGLLGTLVLNIPPPPSDRLWYGFRKNPKLWLSAQPKFGQHAVHVISRIIEKKLCLEFQRLLVLPNMDDFLVPVMSHDIPS